MAPLRNEALRRGVGKETREKAITPALIHEDRSSHVVYFCRQGNGIKVGQTQTPAIRLQAHKNEANKHGLTFSVLAVVHGARNEEQAILEYFKDDLANGQAEFFNLTPRLLQYIRWLRDQSFTEVGDDYDGGIPKDALVFGFEFWKPTAERVKPTSFPLLGETQFEPRVLTGDDYYTPIEVIELVRLSFGGAIDLDPASHVVANKKVRATRFYGKSDDGLSQPWFGNVWLNPPFSQWPWFAEKMIEEIDRGKVTQLLALASLPTLSAAYLRPALIRANMLIIPSGRLDFWGPQVETGGQHGASCGHTLLYFGRHSDDIIRIFGEQYPDTAFFRGPP